MITISKIEQPASGSLCQPLVALTRMEQPLVASGIKRMFQQAMQAVQAGQPLVSVVQPLVDVVRLHTARAQLDAGAVEQQAAGRGSRSAA